MIQPRMVIIAGPPGSGKSSIFPVARFRLAWFNADDRAAELNGGSYAAIPRQVRSIVNREFESFVRQSIDQRISFALETALRSTITFEQAALAKAAGFVTEMRYQALRDFSLHINRVKARADAGGHSASETALRDIYRSSLANLPRALDEMDALHIYDNSAPGGPPALLLESVAGNIVFAASDPPTWLRDALDLD